MISKFIHFLKIGIWEVRVKDLPPVKAFFIKYLRIVILAAHGFDKEDCSKRASALTYFTLFNLVPLVAMIFGIAKGFGLEKLIENQILEISQKANWGAGVTHQIISFSHKLLESAKGGVIAGVGVILLFWSVISILGKIEESMNDIWEVKKSRTLLAKFSDYIAIMVFSPILLIISRSITVVVASKVTFIADHVSLLGVFSQGIFFILNLLPYFSIWILFTLLYLVMPNTKIPLRAGMLGGCVAGTIYQVMQWIYIKFQIGVAGYGAIYGSFAALPLFLVWLQLSWMIVLFGAEIAFAREHHETFGFQPDYSQISVSSKKLLALKVFHLLIKKFDQGEKALNAIQIAQALEIPIRLVQQLLHELMGVGLVVETSKGNNQEVAFQPGRAIENITIQNTIDAYEQYGDYPVPVQSTAETEKFYRYLKNISEIIEKTPGNVLLREI